jgi:putative phosphoesterase
MRMLLFSDSHGDIHNMVKALNCNRDVDLVIHLGDCVSDILKIGEMFPNLKYEFVKGNCDWSRGYPLEKTLEIDGLKIFITHGHLYNVKYDYQRIAQRGTVIGANAVFFGHTHEPEEFFSDGMLVLNPGSIGRARGLAAKSTYCTVQLTEGRIVSRFMSI